MDPQDPWEGERPERASEPSLLTPSPLPSPSSPPLYLHRKGLQATEEPYREAVGALMWLAKMSRPDIANAVRSVARHTHDATQEDWKAVTKILGYLRGTKHLGLTLSGRGGRLVAYADSNYATDRDDRKSVSRGGDFVW